MADSDDSNSGPVAPSGDSTAPVLQTEEGQQSAGSMPTLDDSSPENNTRESPPPPPQDDSEKATDAEPSAPENGTAEKSSAPVQPNFYTPDQPDTSARPRHEEENAGGSAVNVVASHYNSIEETGRRDRIKSRIFYMRNFNNWIKSTLIGEFLGKLRGSEVRGVPLRVLDLGCGKGGDLLKWMRGNVSHVVCADVAEVSVQHCESRYQDMTSRPQGGRLFSAQFITADCTKERLRNLYKSTTKDCIDPTLKFHLVSCQFAFHYCFESLAQANCMMQNAAECLDVGGFFIGTIPNAYEIIRRHKESSNDKFGNEVYEITMSEAAKGYPLFGGRYNFHLHEVVDCPEFLVHFPTLEKLAEKHGLKLVSKWTFEEFVALHQERGRSLLQKINGLELYPPHSGTALQGKEEDYQHAADYLKKHPNLRSVGTLSQPEWEAVSIYMVFAFQKSKRLASLDDFPEQPATKKRHKSTDGGDRRRE